MSFRLFVAFCLTLVAIPFAAASATCPQSSVTSGCPGFYKAGTFTTGPAPRSAAVADFNGDGKPDVVVSNTMANNIMLFLGNGDGTFGTPTTYAVTGAWQNTVRALAVADFNGDGYFDVAVAAEIVDSSSVRTTNAWVFLGNGNGTLRTPTVYLAAQEGTEAIATGDFTGDGKTDIAITNTGTVNVPGVGLRSVDGVSILPGNGDGTFGAAIRSDLSSGGSASPLPNRLAVGDFNKDGKLDLACANWARGDVVLLTGNGAGGFAVTSLGGSADGYLEGVVAGDFNGDGNPDLVAITNGGSGWMLMGNGDGTFAAPASCGMFHGNGAVVADFNLDGKLDLAQGLEVLFGSGDGGFSTAMVTATGFFQAWSPAVGDLNGDGRPDLIIPGASNSATDNFQVFLNRVCTTTAITTSLNPSNYGAAVTFTATVTNSGGAPAPSGLVQFKDGGNNLKAAVTISGGVATLSVSDLFGGRHTITAVYAGDGSNAPSTSTAITQTVNGALSISAVSPSTGTTLGGTSVTISGSGFVGTGSNTTAVTFDGVPATNVVFADDTRITAKTPAHAGGAVDVSVTNSNGQQGVLVGAFTYLATSTTITSYANPADPGQSVTLLAEVSGGTYPSGTVQFYDGVDPLGLPVTVASGQAIYSTTQLTSGPHSITAVYSGDANNGGSTSPALSQWIRGSAGMTLVTSANHVPYTVKAVLTATVAAPTAGWPAPTGVVHFMEGQYYLTESSMSVYESGSAKPLSSSGVAQLMFPSLSGTHTVTAVYGGDNYYTATTSAPITQLVDAPVTGMYITSITPSFGPPDGGTDVTIIGAKLKGTGMAAGSVTFGGIWATNVVFVDAATVTAKTPAHAVGAVDVFIRNSDGLGATSSGGFRYVPKGDANGDGQIGPGDVFYVIRGLFASGPTTPTSDADGDGQTTVKDIFYLINYIFAGGPAPQ